jgi:hypothetical protein
VEPVVVRPGAPTSAAAALRAHERDRRRGAGKAGVDREAQTGALGHGGFGTVVDTMALGTQSLREGAVRGPEPVARLINRAAADQALLKGARGTTTGWRGICP